MRSDSSVLTGLLQAEWSIEGATGGGEKEGFTTPNAGRWKSQHEAVL